MSLEDLTALAEKLNAKPSKDKVELIYNIIDAESEAVATEAPKKRGRKAAAEKKVEDKTEGAVVDNPCWERQKITLGLNYKPMKDIVIKAEWSERLLKSQFNNEPTVSLGVAYSGFFKR